MVSFTGLSGQMEGSSECSGKGAWREEYATSSLLPNQLGAGGVALYAFKVLSTQTDPQQPRCRSQVRAVFLQGTVLWLSVGTGWGESHNKAGS